MESDREMESAGMEIDQDDGSVGTDIDQEMESAGNEMDLLLECENIDTDSDIEEASDCEDVREGSINQDEEKDNDIEEQTSSIVEKNLATTKQQSLVVTDLEGKDFNLKYIQETRLQYPIIFREKSGLDMRMPGIRVRDVKSLVGSDWMVNVMDSITQKSTAMTVGDWEKYRETKDKDKELSVVSFEFSRTKLENYTESPAVIREIDWVEIAWPQRLKSPGKAAAKSRNKMTYPKVQKYCYMSMKDCYTEFHINFDGASVWFHMLHGEQVYWLFPPTPKNLSVYENWDLSANEGDVLADSLEDCQKITLLPNNTFIIPSGWIYAVSSIKESLVYGGYFLHSYNIERQLMVSAIQEKTQVPEKTRYPFHTELCWYVLEHYVHNLTGQTYLKQSEINNDLELHKSSVPSRPESNLTSDNKTESSELEQDTVTPNQSKCVETGRTENIDLYAQFPRRPSPRRQSPRRQSGSDNDSSISDNPNCSHEAGKGVAICQNSASDNSNSMEDIHMDSKQTETLKEAKVNIQADELIGECDSSVKKKLETVNLTKYEKIGLRKLVQWIEGLPSNRKRIPKDLLDPEAVIREIKLILEEAGNDSENVVATGEPAEEMEEEEPEVKQNTTVRCEENPDGERCVNSVTQDADATQQKVGVSNKGIRQEENLPKPFIVLKQYRKGVLVAWKEPPLNTSYSMVLYVVNVLGTKFAECVNSDFSSSMYFWRSGKIVLGKQHSWNINDESHCYIEGLLPSCRYRVFVTAMYLVKKENKLQEVEKDSNIVVFTANNSNKPSFTGMPQKNKVLCCSMSDFSQVVHDYAFKPRSELPLPALKSINMEEKRYNGYTLFFSEKRRKLVNSYRLNTGNNIDFGHISMLLGEQWTCLTDQEKKKWKKKAKRINKQQERYSKMRSSFQSKAVTDSSVKSEVRLQEAVTNSFELKTISDQTNDVARQQDGIETRLRPEAVTDTFIRSRLRSQEGVTNTSDRETISDQTDEMARQQGKRESELASELVTKTLFSKASDLPRLRSEVATRPYGSETTAYQINKNASPEGMRSEERGKRSEDMRNRSEGMDSTEDMRHATEKMRHETEIVIIRDTDPLVKEVFVERCLEDLWRRLKGPQNRCGDCEACNRTVDCRKCKYCLDKRRYGGRSILKQKCIQRWCHAYEKNVARQKNARQEGEKIARKKGKKTAKKKKVLACGSCVGCLRQTNCRMCDSCRDMKKYGGPNIKKQKCRLRQCQGLEWKKAKRKNKQQERYSKLRSSLQSKAVTDSSVKSGIGLQEAITNSFDQKTISDRIKEVARQQAKIETRFRPETVTDSSIRSRLRSQETGTNSSDQNQIARQQAKIETRFRPETVTDSSIRNRLRSQETGSNSSDQNQIARQQVQIETRLRPETVTDSSIRNKLRSQETGSNSSDQNQIARQQVQIETRLRPETVTDSSIRNRLRSQETVTNSSDQNEIARQQVQIETRLRPETVTDSSIRNRLRSQETVTNSSDQNEIARQQVQIETRLRPETVTDTSIRSRIRSQETVTNSSDQNEIARQQVQIETRLKPETVTDTSIRSRLRSQETGTNSSDQNEIARQQVQIETRLRPEAATNTLISSRLRLQGGVTNSSVQETISDQINDVARQQDRIETRLGPEAVTDTSIRSRLRSQEVAANSSAEETISDPTDEVARQQGKRESELAPELVTETLFSNASDRPPLRSEVATRPSGSKTTAYQIHKNASPEGMKSEDRRKRSEDTRNRSEGMDSSEDMRHATEKTRHETEDVMTRDRDSLVKEDFVGRGSEVLQRPHKRCGDCEACNRTVDCRKCKYCLDMRRYGGRRILKQKCIQRWCLANFSNASDRPPLRSEVAIRPSGSKTTAYQIHKNASPEGMKSEDRRKRSEDTRNRSEGLDSTEDMRHATEKMRHETEDVVTRDRDPLVKEVFVERGLEDLQRRLKRPHKRCGDCEACNRTVDCRKCKYCLDKRRYGGHRILKQKCIQRWCHANFSNASDLPRLSSEVATRPSGSETTAYQINNACPEGMRSEDRRKRSEARRKRSEAKRDRSVDMDSTGGIRHATEKMRHETEDAMTRDRDPLVKEDFVERGLEDLRRRLKGPHNRCGDCEACNRTVDCRKCKYCLDKRRYGGRSILKQKCIKRWCHAYRKNIARQKGKERARQKGKEITRKKGIKIAKKKKVLACGSCVGCLRQTNCRMCDSCRDMKKYGGPNIKKQKCRLRQCQGLRYGNSGELLIPAEDSLTAALNNLKLQMSWLNQHNLSLTRCNDCSGCDRRYECGRCDFCQDNLMSQGCQRFGQTCRKRQCLNLGIPDCAIPRLENETVIWDVSGISFNPNVSSHNYYEKKRKRDVRMEDIHKRKFHTISDSSEEQQLEESLKRPKFKAEMDDDDEFEIEIVGDSDTEYLEIPEPPHPQTSSNGMEIVGDADRDYLGMPDSQPQNDSNDIEIVGDADRDYLEMPDSQPQNDSNDIEIVGDADRDYLEMPDSQPQNDSNDIEIVGDIDRDYLEMPDSQPQNDSNDIEIVGDTDRDYLEMPDSQPQNDSNDIENVGNLNLDYLEAPERQPQKSSNDVDLSRDTSSAISEMSKDKIKMKSEETDTNHVVPLKKSPESISDDSSAVDIEIIMGFDCNKNPVAFVKRTQATYTDNSSVLSTT